MAILHLTCNKQLGLGQAVSCMLTLRRLLGINYMPSCYKLVPSTKFGLTTVQVDLRSRHDLAYTLGMIIQ
jgi:hypothetical protein